MRIEPGCPAESLAGHDKGHCYVVIEEEGDRVLLADGRIRTVASPKRKNRKHIRAGSQPLPVGNPITDDAIRRELKNYLRRQEQDLQKA